MAFKKYLPQKNGERSMERVGKTYLLHVMRNLNVFFKWLYTQPGYKKRINLNYVAFFSLAAKDIQIAITPKTKRFPTLEKINAVVKNMPTKTEVQSRDRALIAFLQ